MSKWLKPFLLGIWSSSADPTYHGTLNQIMMSKISVGANPGHDLNLRSFIAQLFFRSVESTSATSGECLSPGGEMESSPAYQFNLVGLPWFGKREMLTQVQRTTKKIVFAARLRPELTFTSFGRHGGTTEASASGLTETQLMKKGQWSSTRAMANYLHDDEEAKQDAQMKRLKRRARQSKEAKGK
jgi:hypothetical protein